MAGPDSASVRAALDAVPGIPCEAEAPTFQEPWQAQAIAMALTLHQRGVFTWTDWATALGEEIAKARAAGDPDDGTTYYRHWLATLERMVSSKGIAAPEMLDRYYQAWDHAADRTPHGQTIVLQPEDFC